MRSQLSFLTVSFFLNLAGFSAVDRAVFDHERSYRVEEKSLKTIQKLGGTQFEFVESPPAPSSLIPEKTRKVSDKDSVAQDLTVDKEKKAPGASPQMEKQGAADQLAQQRFDPSKAATAASSPSGTSSGKLTGRDRITTPAVSRSRSHGAQVYGNMSFEATGSGMGRYMKEMKEKIWLAWFPYLAFHYPKDFRSASATIGFTLAADGRLLSVRVLDTEGGEIFAAFCVEAVQRASPFGPLPAEILDLTGRDDLDAQFVFNFW